MARALLGVSLSLFLLASLSGCGASIQVGAGKGIGAGDPDKNKPTPTDFAGAPGAFAGKWQGSCTYINDGVKNTNCTATLNLKQDTMSTFIMGSLQYAIGYTVSAPSAIRRMEIDGNELKANGGTIGKIGKNALEFYDTTFGDFSVLRFNDETIGVNVMQIPNFQLSSSPPPVDCSTTFCFTATLQKVH